MSVATCQLCRNNFSDPLQTDFINSNPTGTCRACVANLDAGIVPQQPNVGVAPIVDPLAAHKAGVPGRTGYEQANPVTGSETQIPVASGEREPFAVTPQVGNEAYAQGQPPTTDGTYVPVGTVNPPVTAGNDFPAFLPTGDLEPNRDA